MEDEVATPETDVTENQPGEGTTPPAEEKKVVSARDNMLDLIEQQVEEARVREEREAGITPPPAPAAAPPVQEPPQQQVPQTVKVKVYGEEKEVPLDEIVNGYQKVLAADKILEAAARTKKQVDAEAQNLRVLEAQLKSQQQTPPPAGDADERLSKAVEAIYDGDTQTAVQALKELIGTGRETATPTVDVNALTGQVSQQLATQKAVEDFFTNNPDFVGEFDPDMGIDTRTPQRKMGDYLFDTKYDSLVKSGAKSYVEALNDCAAEVRQLFTPAKPAEIPPPPPPKNEREERKNRLDNLPAAGGVRVPQAGEDKDETFDDIITQMRKDRGLTA